MSKQHANKQAGKNNQSQNRQTASDKDSQRQVGASKGNPAQVSRDSENEDVGNTEDMTSKGYQASGRFQQDQDHLDDDEVGNRAQNQNYDRAVQGSSRTTQESNENRGRMAGAKDAWTDDQGIRSQNSDKQTSTNRDFNASSKESNDKDASRRAGSKGDTSSSKR